MSFNRRLIFAVLGMALSSPLGFVASCKAEPPVGPPVASVPKQANVKRHEGFLKDKEALLQKGPIHLVFIGDSITDGWRGKPSYEAAFAAYNPYNIGISAEHTEHVLWRLQNGEIDGIAPELFVMMIGTNNLNHPPQQSPEDTADGIKTLVNTIREKQPKAKILLLAIFPRDEQPTGEMRKKVEATNAIISKLDDSAAGGPVKYMDIAAKFLDDKGVLSKDIFPDSLHPNGKGQQIWADAIRPAVDEILKDVKKLPPPPRESATEGAIKGAAGPNNGFVKRHEQFLKDKADLLAKGPIEFLAVGDSITDGWRGVPNPKDPKKGGGKDVWEKYYAPWNAYNIGIGGDRTQHVIWRLENGEVDGIKPKVAMLMIGTNNLGSNTDDEIAAGVIKCVTTLRAKLPETKVLLLAIFPRSAKPTDGFRARIKGINAMVARLDDGGKTIKFLDIGDKFLDSEGALPTDIMPDALHPNPKGYEIWAEAVKPTLDEMMK
jgi:lysophospholipase L1-like esterase